MELSVREAATLMGRSARTVRAQLARGDLPGKKRNGQWVIDRRQLPLTEAQHQVLQEKAQAVRDAVETALPSRTARHAGERGHSVFDLDAFRIGAEVLRSLRAAGEDALPASARERAAAAIESALLALSEAVLQFERELKLAAVRRSRARLARAVGLLLIEAQEPLRQPLLGWVQRLEGEFGLARRSALCRRPAVHHRPHGRRLAQAHARRCARAARRRGL